MRRTLAFLALLALPVQAAQDPWASIKQGLARVCGYTDVDYICETYHLITTAEFYAKHFREGWTDLLREETEAWLQDAARTILNEGDPNGEVAQTLRELRSRLSEGYYQARATVRRLFREARLSRIRRIAQESGLGEENPAGASGSLVPPSTPSPRGTSRPRPWTSRSGSSRPASWRSRARSSRPTRPRTTREKRSGRRCAPRPGRPSSGSPPS